MIYLHFLMSILATWRITELISQDRITQSFRQRFPTYLWGCPRCVSVWAGMWAALMLVLGPVTHDWSRWSLWPFALAWVYLMHIDTRIGHRMEKEGRRLIIEARGAQWTLTRNDFTPQETQEMTARILSAAVEAQHPAPPAQPVPERPSGAVQ